MENDQSHKTAVEQIIDASLETGIRLFHDQYKEAYISIDGTGRNILALHSRLCLEWLGHYCYETLGKVMSQDILNKIINTLSGTALFDGEMKELQVRAVKQDSSILWYDLGESVVLVGSNMWSIFEDPPILFKRFQHQKNQVIPVESDNIELIRSYINLKNDDDYLLFLVYLISAFIPGFPHPLLILHGSQGSGKTTPMRVIKELVDPSSLQGLPAPSKPEDFVHVASKHFFLFFDNLSSMPTWLSDTLARASTGDGFSKRALYSNDDDVIYSFQRTIAINGINQVVTRSDLLDRAILLNLERIPDNKRIEEFVYWETFNHDKPSILGSIFTVLGRALELHSKIQLDKLPRMADFYRWGCAITQAMGQPKEKFMHAYEANVSNQHDEAIEASPVALAIIDLMESRDFWEGTATDLLNTLNSLLDTPLHARSAGLPQHPNWLSRNLILLQPNLLTHGIVVGRRDTARPRKIIIRKDSNLTVGTDVSFEIEAIEKHFGQVEQLDNIEDPFINRQYDDTDGKNLRPSKES